MQFTMAYLMNAGGARVYRYLYATMLYNYVQLCSTKRSVHLRLSKRLDDFLFFASACTSASLLVSIASKHFAARALTKTDVFIILETDAEFRYDCLSACAVRFECRGYGIAQCTTSAEDRFMHAARSASVDGSSVLSSCRFSPFVKNGERGGVFKLHLTIPFFVSYMRLFLFKARCGHRVETLTFIHAPFAPTF